MFFYSTGVDNWYDDRLFLWSRTRNMGDGVEEDGALFQVYSPSPLLVAKMVILVENKAQDW
ncbi:hypothetical protein QQP08_018408 [Theobroma cacao]|nr:hypothetical protein QQP08_018408 [Theobroma cacao]